MFCVNVYLYENTSLCMYLLVGFMCSKCICMSESLRIYESSYYVCVVATAFCTGQFEQTGRNMRLCVQLDMNGRAVNRP